MGENPYLLRATCIIQSLTGRDVKTAARAFQIYKETRFAEDPPDADRCVVIAREELSKYKKFS